MIRPFGAREEERIIENKRAYGPTFSKEKPPVYDQLLKRFGGAAWENADDAVVAWDGVIYAKHELAGDVVAHELVHLEQQKIYVDGLEVYLDRYLHDDEFRMWQEVLAFRRQIEYLENENPPRPDIAWCREKFARDLCDFNIYDLEMTHAQAVRLLS